MKKVIFPYCLERSTNVTKEHLQKIECMDLIASIDMYEQAVEELNVLSSLCVNALEQAYSKQQNPDILKTKRKISAQKPTSGVVHLSVNEKVLIQRYNAQLEKTLACRESYRELYSSCLNRNRCYVRAVVAENADILRTLPLINKDFIYKLDKYMSIPVDKHTAKIRKLDHQMIRLFTRAITKTSPFSFLTSVCLYPLQQTQTERYTSEERTSLCEINNYILKAIYSFIVQREHFAKQIEYRLTAHKEYADRYVFLYQRDYEKGKVYKTVDATVSVKKSPIIDLVVSHFNGSVFHYEDLLNFFVEHGAYAQQAAGIIYKNFILGNLIVPCTGIDDTHENIYADFYEKTGKLKDDEDGRLQSVLERVRAYEQCVSRFVHADWRMRFQLVQKQDSLLGEIETLLDKQFAHNILLYEDSMYAKPKNPISAQEWDSYEWEKLQLFFSCLDQSALTYLLFSDMFAEQFGEKQIQANDLDVYKLFVEAASRLTDIWKDNFSQISFETSDKIRRITEIKQAFFDVICRCKEEREPQNLKAWIDEIVENNADLFFHEIDSATVFFQKSDSGELIFNKVYKGQLLFFTRFLKLFSANDAKIQEYCRHAFGSNPLEITESFGFNANVHQRIFKHRLVLDLTERNDASNGDIPIEECFFYYDAEKKLVKLMHKDFGEINGVFLGSLAQNLMPISLRTINGMQPSTRFDPTFMNLWNAAKKETLIADHIPRIQYGGIVFLREQYLINSSYNLSRPVEELYMEILRDFRAAGLPMKFFIRPYINGADFDFYNMGRTSLKPQYIDLSSPLLFQEFLREMGTQAQFLIEEQYPDNLEDDYVCEYQIESTIYAS